MENTTNWDPSFYDEEQEKNSNVRSTEGQWQQPSENDETYLKSAEADGYEANDDDDTLYNNDSGIDDDDDDDDDDTVEYDDDDDDDDDDDIDTDGTNSDWGTVDPQSGGRSTDMDPSGPGSAV